VETSPRITVHTVPSRGSIRIPATDLLVDGALTLDPAVQSKGYFSVQFKGTELELTAGGYCGYIPLNESVAVNVQPKMPIGNLSRVFDVTALSLHRVLGTSRSYGLGLSANAPIIEFLGAELSALMKTVIDRGLHKSYELRSFADSYPRGRIDLTSSIRRNFARGRSHVLDYTAYFHTMDVPANRVLKAAGELVLNRLLVQIRSNRGLIADLARVLSYFAGAGRLRSTDLSSASGDAGAESTPATVEYSAAIDVAKIILHEQSTDIEKTCGDIDLTAVVVDFDSLFEEYLRNVLKLDQHKRNLEALVVDGNKAGKKELFDGKPNPKAQPDVVIKSKDGRARLIVEIKYKSAPDRGDINQAVTYALSYRVQPVIIAHQVSTALDAGLRKIGSIAGIDLYRYGINLAASDLQKEEEAFSDVVFTTAGMLQ
jgi:5-methylcytosine-specific restriction enzyme subunit McrC